jgi:elongation factor P--beta-lysine ligase
MDSKDYITFDEEGGPDLLAPATVDTVTLNLGNYSNTVIGGGYSFPNTASALGGPYTFGAGTGITNPWATSSTKIQLDGEGADIKINDWSLVDAIQKIEERLNILTPNTELEAEWAELRALGDQYRRLERHIREKQATWDRLKAMPPPAID